MSEDKRPNCKVQFENVTVNGKDKYTQYANGELWKEAGEHSYRAGYVMNHDDIGAVEYAIDMHEEEMRILLAEARAEFGL